jgi:hypothetical protein
VERPPAAAKRWIYLLSIAGWLLYVPMDVHAEWSIIKVTKWSATKVTDWIVQILHWRTPAPEESTLAPQVASLPPVADLLRGLHSRFLNMRLAALDALTQSRDASPRVIASLVRATQDHHPQVAERASIALSTLCRAGHTNEVLKAFGQELGMRPEPRLLPSDYHFKILDVAEDERAQLAFNSRE